MIQCAALNIRSTAIPSSPGLPSEPVLRPAKRPVRPKNSDTQISNSWTQNNNSGTQNSNSWTQISNSGTQISNSWTQNNNSGTQISNSWTQNNNSGTQISNSWTQNNQNDPGPRHQPIVFQQTQIFPQIFLARHHRN